jgi:hypothetical protein
MSGVRYARGDSAVECGRCRDDSELLLRQHCKFLEVVSRVFVKARDMLT